MHARTLRLVLIGLAACAANMILSRSLQAAVFLCTSEVPTCGWLSAQQGLLELLQLPGSHLSSWFEQGALARWPASLWWWFDGVCWGLAAFALAAWAERRRTR